MPLALNGIASSFNTMDLIITPIASNSDATKIVFLLGQCNYHVTLKNLGIQRGSIQYLVWQLGDQPHTKDCAPTKMVQARSWHNGWWHRAVSQKRIFPTLNSSIQNRKWCITKTRWKVKVAYKNANEFLAHIYTDSTWIGHHPTCMGRISVGRLVQSL